MPLSKAASVAPSGVLPVVDRVPTVDPRSPARPRFRLSGFAVRSGWMVAALSVLIVVTVVSIVREHDLSRGLPSPRHFLVVVIASTVIGMLAGVFAGFLIHSLLPRLAALAAIALVPAMVYPALSVSLAMNGHDASIWQDMGMHVWCWAPFSMLLTAAALSAIPRRLFESAAVDRLRAGFTVRTLTFPLVAPLLFLCALFLLSQALHDKLLQGSTPVNATRPWQVALTYAVLVASIALGALSARVITRFRSVPTAGGT